MTTWSALEALGPVRFLNVVLCIAAGLVGVGAMNRMTRETEPHITLSFMLIATGMLAALVGYFLPGDWQSPFETLLYGGVLALLVGTRRQTEWIDPRWMRPLSTWISIATAAAFFLGVA